MKNRDYNQGYRDGIERAIVIARSLGLPKEFIMRLESEIIPDENLLKLSFGESYLVLEEMKKMGFQIVKQISSRDIDVLIITRDISYKDENPKNKIFYITYENVERSVNPTDLSKIDSIVRNNFKQKSALFIDSLEYIYNQNQEKIQPLIKLISSLKDFIYRESGILIISLDPRILKEQDFIQLKKEFTTVLNFMR